MALPKAVLEMERKAEALRKEAYPEQYKKDELPKKEEPEAKEEEEEVVKPVEEKTDVDPALPQAGEKPVAQNTDGAIKVPVPAKPEGPSGDTSSQVDAEKHKFSVLQGKYNAEVPVLQTRIRELESAIESLKAGAETKSGERKSGEYASKLKEDLEGSETAENILGTIREETEAVKKDLLAEIKKSVQPLNEKAALTDEQKFYSGLSQVENWREINKNAEFSKWLDTLDSLTGYTYRAWLNDAWHKKNATRAVEIFKKWPGYKQSAKPQTKVEELVSPGRKTSQAETKIEPETERISQAQIKSFYKDVQNNKYTEDEVNKYERVLEKAIQERRVD